MTLIRPTTAGNALLVTSAIYFVLLINSFKGKERGKGRVLATALLPRVRLVTRRAFTILEVAAD